LAVANATDQVLSSPPSIVQIVTILRGAALLVVVGATAITVGCGGGGSEARLSKEEYIKEFKALGGELESTLNELDNVDFKNATQVARAADQVGGEFERIGSGAADLNPPEEITEANSNLATAIQEFGVWFHDLAETIRTTPRADLEQTLEQDFGFAGLVGFDLSKIEPAKKIEEAVNELKDKGYSFADGAGQCEATGPGDAAAGKEVFSSADCGGCHTLADAGATGVVGPSLDDSRPPYGLVIQRVKNGQGIMPAFATQLSEKQIQDVAAYVSQAAGG
jgi:cytochrome c553